MKYNLLFLILYFAYPSFAQQKNQSIGFKENKGQIIDQKGKPNTEVKYLLNTSGLNVQIRANGFSYDIYETKKHPLTEKQKAKLRPSLHPETEKEKLPDYSLEYIYHRIDIDFVHSNPKVELITEQKSKDYDNYYNIPNKPDGVLMVHQYQQITYKNIYPNIDVVFSIPKDSLKAVEYNFVVHPKGKISDIQMRFNGAKTELVDNKIRMQVRFGAMEETLPMSWTEDGKNKKEIAVGYTKIKKNVYGFESAENVSGKTVVIDPVPNRLWGTFYGGENEETTNSLEIDILGNSYICGTTSSKNFIATNGAHQFVFGSSIYYGPHLYITDGYVAKFDENGNRLWSTFYGGETDDEINDIAVSNNNLIGFCGNSWSNNNISTIGSFKDFKSGSYGEMYFGVLNTNGVRLWASYYGNDNGLTFANTMAVDQQNFFYISGTTTSDAYIATPNSFKETIIDNNEFDGFLTKFDQNGNRIWGTYFGGDSDDFIEDLTFDSNSNIIIAGYTISTNGISTPNSYKQYLSSNNYDGFIASFTNTGVLNWGTYFGSTEDDKILRVKNFNNTLYLSGTTNSTDLATPNAFETINQNGNFISKFNIQNQKKIWLSYSSVKITDFDINKNEEIYLVGEASTISNIATPNAFSSSNNGFVAYVRKLNNNCAITWGTYLGSQGFINQSYIKYLNNDIFYVAGTCYTYWSSPQYTNYGLTTPNSFQEISNGNREAYINKFKDCNLSSLISSNSPICIGNTIELKASGGTNYSWTGPNGFTSSVQNPTINNASALNTGKYSCSITGTGGCDGVVDVDVFVGDNQPPVPNLATLPTITGNCKTTITTVPTATDACAGAITATTESPLSYSLPGTYTIVWDYDDGNANISHQNQTVTISPQPLPTTTSPQTFCIQQNATLSAIDITGQNIKWYDALTNGNLLANTTLLQNGMTYYASQTINGCESLRTPVSITIQNTATPTAISPQTFCSGQNPTLNTILVAGTGIKWYDSPIAGGILPDSTPLQDGTTYYATQTVNGCESPTRLAVTIALIASLPANNYNDFFCDDLNDGTETVDLSSYNKVVASTSGYFFTYYHSISGAENERVSDKITNFSSYKLALGENKIYVRINSSAPCYAVATLTLTLFPKPFINIQDIVPICENKKITIDAGSGFDDYLWSDGKKTTSIAVDAPGNYAVTVTQKHGSIACSATKNFEVVLSNVATITSIETKDWTDTENTIIINIASSSIGDYEYSIDGVHYQTSNQFTGLLSGKYSVQVRDKNGCGTASDKVYLLMYPKYFTPNGDGINDSWNIKFSAREVGLSVKIYDRFGKLIKNLSTNTDSWDGTYNGIALPATDYWFVVTRANGQEHKGHFSLKR